MTPQVGTSNYSCGIFATLQSISYEVIILRALLPFYHFCFAVKFAEAHFEMREVTSSSILRAHLTSFMYRSVACFF